MEKNMKNFIKNMKKYIYIKLYCFFVKQTLAQCCKSSIIKRKSDFKANVNTDKERQHITHKKGQFIHQEKYSKF